MTKLALPLLVAILCQGPAFAQTIGTGGEPYAPPFARLALGLILCAFVALLVVLALKRFAGGRPFLPPFQIAPVADKPVRIFETHRLSTHADLCRLRYRDKEFLVIVAAGAVTILADHKADTAAMEQAP